MNTVWYLLYFNKINKLIKEKYIQYDQSTSKTPFSSAYKHNTQTPHFNLAEVLENLPPLKRS